MSHLQIAPLIIITIVFWLSYKPVFKKPMSSLSLRTAVDLDHNDRLVGTPSAVATHELCAGCNPAALLPSSTGKQSQP